MGLKAHKYTSFFLCLGEKKNKTAQSAQQGIAVAVFPHGAVQ